MLANLAEIELDDELRELLDAIPSVEEYREIVEAEMHELLVQGRGVEGPAHRRFYAVHSQVDAFFKAAIAKGYA